MKKRFIRFSVVGVVATLVHVFIFSMLVEFFGAAPVVASVPAFLMAMFASYGANHRWTFGAKGLHQIYLPKYTATAIAGLGLNISITYVVVNLLGYWYGIALIVVIMVVPVTTFMINSNWIFNLKDSKE